MIEWGRRSVTEGGQGRRTGGERKGEREEGEIQRSFFFLWIRSGKKGSMFSESWVDGGFNAPFLCKRVNEHGFDFAIR